MLVELVLSHGFEKEIHSMLLLSFFVVVVVCFFVFWHSLAFLDL